MGIGFAAPASTAKRAMEDILKYYKKRNPWGHN